MNDREYKYLFGPVASRRLGRSLGVDIVPYKTCSYDCIYCQCGKTTDLTVLRKEYVDTNDVIAELKERTAHGLDADYITFSGSGEPTLHSSIGRMIGEIKKMTRVPVAVLTNGSLLYDKGVRESLYDADLVIPSLDAGSKDVFDSINRSSSHIDFERMVEGLIAFGREFKNELYLEVLLVEGVNTDIGEIKRIKGIAERIKPAKIQLNTVYRPTAEDNLRPVSAEKMESIRKIFGDRAQVINAGDGGKTQGLGGVKLEDVISLLKRRPCTPRDVAEGLGAKIVEVNKCIGYLKENNLVESSRRDGRVYYCYIGD